VFALSYGKDTIYKYRIATEKWDKVLNIEEKSQPKVVTPVHQPRIEQTKTVIQPSQPNLEEMD